MTRRDLLDVLQVAALKATTGIILYVAALGFWG